MENIIRTKSKYFNPFHYAGRSPSSILQSLIPSISVLLSFDDISVIYFSASIQDNKQIKRLLEISFFDKIKNCIYRNVEGFFLKYFEKRKWSKRNNNIYQVVKDRHADD